MTQLAGVAEDVTALLSRGPTFARNAVEVIDKIGPHLGTVRRVVDDPAFATVMARIKTLADMEAGGSSSTPTTPTPPSKTGIGLKRAVPILDVVIYARRNPWIALVIGGGVVAMIAGVGYRLGQRKRST